MTHTAREVTEVSWILHKFLKKDLSFAFLMCVFFKKYYNCNTVLRSTGEVSRGSILFIFYILNYERKGRESYSPSVAAWTISKAIWQTCTSVTRISHWIGASMLRMGCDEHSLRNGFVSDTITFEWTLIIDRSPHTSVVSLFMIVHKY